MREHADEEEEQGKEEEEEEEGVEEGEFNTKTGMF